MHYIMLANTIKHAAMRLCVRYFNSPVQANNDNLIMVLERIILFVSDQIMLSTFHLSVTYKKFFYIFDDWCI